MSGSLHKPPITRKRLARLSIHCGFRALVVPRGKCFLYVRKQGNVMKKVALAFVLVVAGLSLGGCFVGKGKAPAPIVTKG